MTDKLLLTISNPKFYLTIIYIVLAIIVFLIIKSIILKNGLKNKRQRTIQKLVTKIIKYVIVIFTIIICLDAIGFNVTSFIAGLGIASVVVGLALQDIMKDFLSGMFIIIEDHYDVGDLVEINGFVGEVVSLELKTTKLKNNEGKIKIISNRNINDVINYSKCNNKLIMEVSVSSNEDVDKTKILDNICKKSNEEIEEIVSYPEILGIDRFDKDVTVYKISFEVKQATGFAASSKIKKIIKEELNNKHGVNNGK